MRPTGHRAQGVTEGRQTGHRRGFSHLWWVGAIAVPLAAAVVMLAERGFAIVGMVAPVRAQLAAHTFLVEAAMTVLAAPLAGVWAMTNVGAAPGPASQHLSARLRAATSLVLPLVGGATLLAATSVSVTLALDAPGTSTVLISHAVLWVAALTLAALGTLCAAAFRDPLDAVACALGGAIVVSLGLLVTGPVLDGIPTSLLDVALLANPIVATASSANIDVLRIDPFYQLSPLAHTRVDYPTPATTLASYGMTALLLFAGTTLLINRRARIVCAERISA